jgi:biofilm protein TabA
MIINTLKNLSLYSKVYSHLPEAVSYLKDSDVSKLIEGKNEISDNSYIVKIVGDKKSDFEGVLEVHKEWIDIHIPLTDDEIVAFKEISECQTQEKDYDIENDYALYRESDISQVTLSKGYFAIIDTTMAHMAMLGEGKIEKLVVKIRK